MVLTFLGAIGGFLAKIFSALAKWAGYWFAYRLGRKKVEAENTKEMLELTEGMADAATNSPDDRTELVERLRRTGVP